METAIGYIRVSTRRQQDEGLSLKSQLDLIKKYCEFNKLDFIGYRSDAISGKFIKNRPGALEVMDMLEHGQAKNVVVLRLERLFRNTRETLRYIDLFEQWGVGFHSITERLDTKSAIGRCFVTIIAAMNQMEREKTAERTAETLHYKKEQNHRLGRFHALGKQMSSIADPKDGKVRQLEDNPQELKGINLAKKLRKKGMSYGKISQELWNKGYKNRKDEPFHRVVVREMVLREF